MKTKSILIALCALMGFVGNVMADTDLLLEADGWTKITTLPTSTEIANNYYVIVDNSSDLMLGIAKGVYQDTKWYSLGVYYQTSVSPTTKDILSKTWTLETQGDGYALRNLEYSVSPIQTEWGDARKFDTNDIYETANDWAKILLAYTDGYWTIQNGYYPNEGYVGPWVDGNFTNGAECAANKTGANIGKFQIYAITRDQFKQNLLDNASSTNPVDLTPFYVKNATFDGNNINEWTAEGSGNNFNYNYLGCEIWHRSNFNMYQTLSVPKGKYKVSIQTSGSTSGTVYGTSAGTTVTANTNTATENNYQNSVLAMIQNREHGKIITDEITVNDGSLIIGFKDETTNQWDVFDNFKIYCTGIDLQAYIDQLEEAVNEANSFIQSDVVPEAVETIISNAITEYNKSYETAKAYSEAILALRAVLNEYKNNIELQNAYAAYKAMRANVQALADETKYNYTDENGAKATFDNAITTANNAVEGSTTTDAILTQTANIRSAGLTFVSNVTADSNNPFDLTFLASQNYSDWKKKDGSAAGIVADQFLSGRPADIPPFAESYESTCATTGTVLYQTVSDLPEGYYQVTMYAQALYTPGREFDTEATEGDADRSFAFAGDQRTGLPIKFGTSVAFQDLTTLDVNVHLTATGDLTFGVQKDANGSNWHFAQIASIVYSNTPDLTNLMATRDAQVAEAMGILNGADANYLTEEQKQALQDAIDEANAANTFDTLNTVTLTTMPNAITTARQQIAAAKANRVEMIAALERFERDYNLVDGTDYSRVTMSEEAWTALLAKVNVVSLALDDISQVGNYGTLANELNAQMDATDVSIRLFKSYKAMVEGTTALSIFTETDDMMDSDATEQAAIVQMNTAFVDYAANQSENIDMAAFLGENLDFNTPQGDRLIMEDNNNIYDIVGWEEEYGDLSAYCFLENSNATHENELYLRANWTSSAVMVKALKLKMLPVGKYQLTMKWNSDMQNMTNLSQYSLGDDVVVIGKSTNGYETLVYDFEVTDQATAFDLVFGFRKQGSGNTPAQILVDDVTLTCLLLSEFQMALDAARSVSPAQDVTNSAIAQFEEYEGHEDLFDSDDARRAAIEILKNAKTIADNGNVATGIIKNADFSGGTSSGAVQGSGGQVVYPANWNFAYTFDGWNDTKMMDGNVFNVWAGTITRAELSQALSNLPNGAYRLTADVLTDTETASSQIATYGLDGSNIGRSEEVGNDIAGSSDYFATYTCAFDVTDNAATIGIRSDHSYFKLKNIKLEYIGLTAEEETDASYLRQDYYWDGRNTLWYDATGDKYANAKDVVVYPQQPNQLVKALDGQFANADNKIVEGVCASFVITDRYPISVEETFTAQTVTYSRTLAQDDAAYTIFLPYSLSSNDDVTFYTLTSYQTDGFHFNKVETTDAMTPYLAIAANDASLNATNVEVALTSDTHEVTADGYTMKGSILGINREEAISQNAYVMQSDNQWKKVGSSSPEKIVPTFRAYISAPATTVNTYIASWFDNETAIHALPYPTELPEGAVYDLQGRKLYEDASHLPHGIYVINGKKYVVK